MLISSQYVVRLDSILGKRTNEKSTMRVCDAKRNNLNMLNHDDDGQWRRPSLRRAEYNGGYSLLTAIHTYDYSSASMRCIFDEWGLDAFTHSAHTHALGSFIFHGVRMRRGHRPFWMILSRGMPSKPSLLRSMRAPCSVYRAEVIRYGRKSKMHRSSLWHSEMKFQIDRILIGTHLLGSLL